MPHPAVSAPRQTARHLGWSLPWLGGYLVLTLVSNRPQSLVDAGPTMFWPSAGLALAWLLLASGGRFPWAATLFVAATLALQLVGAGSVPLSMLLVALAHVVLVLGAHQLLTRRAGEASDWPGSLDLTTTADLLRLGRAALIAAAVTAAPASLAVALDTGQWEPWIWLVWVARNAVTMFAVGGMLVLLAQLLHRHQQGVPWRLQLVAAPRARVGVELVALALSTAGLGYLVFGLRDGLPVSFVLVALAVWTGLRFTPVVVSVYVVAISVFGAYATGAGLGTFSSLDDPLARSVIVHLFISFTATAGLMLSTSTLGHRHLTQSLAEATARFDGLLNRLDDFIWSAEVRPDGSMRLLFASARGAAVFGGPVPALGEDDAYATLLAQVVPEDRALVVAFRDDLLRLGSAETEFRLRGVDDGVVRWAWSRASARSVGGRMVLEGITTDVTERKGLDDLRNQFLAIAGHELRTPLTVIRGYAETLGERVEHDPAAAQQAAAIARRAEQLEALVGDFFDLATYENGRVSLTLVPVDLAGLVGDAVEDHAPAVAEQEMSLTSDARPVTVAADLTRLRQVLDNLLDNAVKYGRPGGAVSVTCDQVDGRAIITVTDDGIGVPAEELPHVFERFFRASSGQQQTVFGTGLGLAVVKAIVETHGGEVNARMREGGGFVVVVDLPVFVVPAPAEHRDGAAGPLGAQHDADADATQSH